MSFLFKKKGNACLNMRFVSVIIALLSSWCLMLPTISHALAAENAFYPSKHYCRCSANDVYPANNCCPQQSLKPIASAIAIPSVVRTYGTTLVTLDGSSSRISSGNEVLRYSWTQVRGLPALTINNSAYAKATVIIPSELSSQPNRYVFKLVVINKAGLSDSAEVSVSTGGGSRFATPVTTSCAYPSNRDAKK